MREAHRAGLRTTATMMYGTVETDEERLEHLLRLRALQDETGGFTAFITWSYQPEHTERGGTEATGVDYLRTLAIARLVLDNFDNLQASWVTQGGKVGQLSLAFGANDMGSVMIEENVVRAAGAAYCMDELEIVRNIEDAGFTASRRTMHYERLGTPVFRERERAAAARTGHRARRRRHVGAGRAGQLPGAQRRGEAAARRRAAIAGGVSAGPAMASLLVRAAWVCPVLTPPLAGGWVHVRDGVITACGQGHDAPAADRELDLGRAVVLPGLVNAHTHLELSWLRGRVPPAADFLSWVGQLLRRRAPARRHPTTGRPSTRCVPPSPSCGPPAPWRSATSPTRWCRRRCSADWRCRRSCSTSCWGLASPTARRPLADGSRAPPRPGERRGSRRRRRARAVLGLARALPGDS